MTITRLIPSPAPDASRCYIVPLAVLPDDGCPGSDGCWKYIFFIFLYILFCTALIPLLIAQTVRHFSREVTRLTNEHRSDGSKSTIRLTFFKRSQNLLVMAYRCGDPTPSPSPPPPHHHPHPITTTRHF